MNDVVTFGHSLVDEDIAYAMRVEKAKELISNRHSKATREAYASDWSLFQTWCKGNKFKALPASVESVVMFIEYLVDIEFKASTIGRKLAAIKYEHSKAGINSPTDLEPVKAAYAGAKRMKGTKPKQAAPLTIDLMVKILDTCDTKTLRGIRDKALLAIGFGGALRRSELADLTVKDIQITDSGLMVDIKKSKTDQEGKGQRIAILQGDNVQVKTLYRQWLRASGIKSGYVFRGIDRKGNLNKAITPKQIYNIVKKKASLAGLDPAQFSGHSLRAGFITSAAQNDADVFSIMDVSRHKNMNTVRQYVRNANLFKKHAGSEFM